ncbi:MAG TPA: MMPL family transporter [Candidatus Poseidoniales archaeon]|nr:MAG TPA: MMPL family transporter [Candidatus Poseidoniales archaeon]HII27622.1 MMPL family transporter [Poseidonia sp.]
MEGATDPEMLKDRAFFKFGLFIHDHKASMMAFGLISCILMGSLITIGSDWAEGFGEDDVESINGLRLLSQRFATEDDSGGQSFRYLVFHPTHNDTSEAWKTAVMAALAEFDSHPDITVNYSWQAEDVDRKDVVQSDEDGTYAINKITMEMNRKDAKSVMTELRDSVDIENGFESWMTDGIFVDWTFDDRIKNDLIKAEVVAVPLTLIILGLIFGSLIAAILPMGIGGGTLVAAIGMTIWLSNITDVTVYATNIVSLIGIGVSIDYSLFLVNRFREELSRGHDVRTATAMSCATAGKAVFYSGITVAIGLMGQLFFANTSLPSLGIGGTIAVTIAMVYSTIVLPAVMAWLGPRINKLKIPYAFDMSAKDDGMWARIAKRVMDRPWAVLIPTLVLLIGAGLPFAYAEFSLSSWKALPPDDEARLGMELIDEQWPDQAANTIFIIVDTDGADPLSEANLRAQHAFLKELLTDPRVLGGTGVGMPDNITANETVQFWQTPDEYLTPEQIAVRESLRKAFVGDNATFMSVQLKGVQTNVDSRELVEEIRQDRDDYLADLSGENDRLLVAGFAAYNADNLEAIADNLPRALAFILLATTALIFIQVRSVIIPIKAIAMNILSISASFGMLVWVFQWGFGAELLNFTAQPIDSGNPVIMFCIVFGLSMDYEVLMLSRIHEEWERTGDNTLAVANGLQKTGGLITGAAAIMVVVFCSFGLSSVIILKQIGLGLALAIFIDATLVRALVVPSTMRLMGKWNWWAPAFLRPSPTTHDATAPLTQSDGSGGDSEQE